MKKISIITITLNNIIGLKITVNSVLKQKNFADVEYIIIDGDSNDGTQEYLKELNINKVKWISEKDRGISHAFNKGLLLASGEAVLFLNSGDYFIDDCIIGQYLEDWKKENVDIMSYKVQIDEKRTIPSNDDEHHIWTCCSMPHQGTFVLKRVYDEIGAYSETYKIRMDYDFFARCIQRGYKFRYIPRIIVHYEAGGVSMKNENRIRFWKEGMVVKYLYGLHIGCKDYIKIFFYH